MHVFSRHPLIWASCCLLVILAIGEFSLGVQRTLQANARSVELAQRASDARTVLERELYPAIYAALGVSSYLEMRQGQFDENEIYRWLATLYSQSDYLRNIAIAPANRIEVVFPMEQNMAVLGLYYPDLPAQWPTVERIMAEGVPLLQGPIELIQGGNGLIYRIPVFVQHEYWGLVSSVINADALFAVLQQYSDDAQLQITLRQKASHRDTPPFWQSSTTHSAEVAAVPFEVAGVAWTLAVSSQRAVPPYYQVARIVLWVIAVLLSGLVGLWLHGRRAEYLTSIDNQRLASQVAQGETLLLTLWRLLPDVVLIVDRSGLLTNVHDHTALPDSAANLRGQPIASLLPPEQHNELKTGLATAFQEAEVVAIEYAVSDAVPDSSPQRTAITTSRWYELRLLAVDDERAVAIIRDVTEQRAQAQALAEAEERQRAILEGTHIGTWQWNVQTGETTFNERWAEIVGYTLAELSPISIDTWQALAHPDDLAASAQQLQEHFCGERPYYDIVCRMRHRDGHYVWVHDRGRVMSWTEDGQPLMMYGTHADVTEQVEAQQALAAQEHLLRTIIDHIPINIYIKDRTGRKILANKAECEFMGVDVTAFQRRDDEFLPPALAALAQQEDERVFTTGQPLLNIEHASVAHDGAPQWQLVSKLPLTNADGEVDQLLGIMVDLTERKNAELALQASRDQYLSLVENIPGMSYRCLMDQDWTMLYMSVQVDAISGYPASDFINNAVRTYASVIHPADNEENWRQVQAAMAAGQPWTLKYRVQHRNGETRWVYEKGRAICDDSGVPQYLDGFVFDITDQVRAETALKESEARLRALFELSPVGIALNDFETGAFIDVNDALLASAGYDRETFLALTYWQVTPPEYEAAEALAQEQLRNTGRYGPFEKEYINCFGERYPVRLNGVLIEDRGGRHLIWSIIEDMREHKRIERLKNEFVATVSHELRTPLTSISGALSLVRNGVLGDVAPAALEMVAMAHDSSQQLTLLINDLLDMEKLIAGKMRLTLEDVDVLAVIHELLPENQVYADQFGVTLDVQATAPIPLVQADPQRLRQVLTNLLSNAAKFTREQSTVVIRVYLEAQSVVVAVVDQGPGIAPEFAEKIFGQFSQADSSDTRKRGGTGLGLAIAQRLMHLMQGTLHFDTELGQGSTFYVTLPLHAEDETHD